MTRRERDMAVVLAGRRAGKPLREIAVDLCGREQVDAEWHAGGWMCAKLRRLLGQADAASDGAGLGAA